MKNERFWLDVAIGLFMLSGVIVIFEWMASGDNKVDNPVLVIAIILFEVAAFVISLVIFAKWLMSKIRKG